jgi:hypothetical protein
MDARHGVTLGGEDMRPAVELALHDPGTSSCRVRNWVVPLDPVSQLNGSPRLVKNLALRFPDEVCFTLKPT